MTSDSKSGRNESSGDNWQRSIVYNPCHMVNSSIFTLTLSYNSSFLLRSYSLIVLPVGFCYFTFDVINIVCIIASRLYFKFCADILLEEDH